MDLSTLKPSKGSTKKNKRIGRGQGSGRGGTSTRGHKGAQSRSGYKTKKGFEGGQMPLQRRIPKRGFKNINRKNYVVLNLDGIQYYAEKFDVAKIDMQFLKDKKIIQQNDLVKVLADGDITKKIDIAVTAISKSALAKLEQAGGAFTTEK